VKLGRRAACLAALAWGVPPGWAVESADGPEQALRDDADFAAGMAALRAGDAAAALGRFDRALRRFPEAADLHNELGYTHRRLGSLDKAFEHYRRALAIDPRHRGAHEYIGETYLLIDDLAGAERHLKALREICLLPCDEAKELQAAIDGYRAKRRPS
jgi:tetratricopeptide (TPR) repeat protein